MVEAATEEEKEFIEPEVPEGAEPVGEGDYVVRKGDCMGSIAEASGFFWETLWEDPANAELKRVRRDPNILLPGDRVTIPEWDDGTRSCVTDKRHVFKRRGVPELLKLQFFDEEGEPRADEPYRLTIGRQVFEEQTDGEGFVEQWIPNQAQRGELLFLWPDGETKEEYKLKIGGLDPVETVEGAAARMQSLGFYQAGGDFDYALECFQTAHELEPTVELDQETRDKLVELYGS